jgi:type IV secretion system protein VirD4
MKGRWKWYAAWAVIVASGALIMAYLIGAAALLLSHMASGGGLDQAITAWKADLGSPRSVLRRLVVDRQLRTEAFGLTVVLVCGVGALAIGGGKQAPEAPLPASHYGSHGTGRWATPEEIVATFPEEGAGALLGRLDQGRRWRPVVFPWSSTRRNRFVLLIGPPGSGKTYCYSLPNLLHAAEVDRKRTLVLTDPKGDLHRDTASHLQKRGFQVLTLNLIDFAASSRYNPMDYVSTPEQAQKLAATILANTDGAHGGGDPFWREAEGSLLACMIWFVKATLPAAHQHLGCVLHLTAAFGANKELMNQAFARFDQNDSRRRLYGPVALLEDKTRTGVFVGVTASRLKIWASEQITSLTAASDFRIRDLAQKPTVLYLIIPDADPTYRVLSSLFFDQVFQELIAEADEGGGRLKVECRLLLEEMANIGRIPDLDKRLATIRSRGILVEMVLQTLGQLKALYGEAWNTICGCADTLVVLGANDLETARYVSDRLGTTTIRTASVSQTQAEHGGSEGLSYSYTARPLMLPDEVAGQGEGGLGPDELLLVQRGLAPARLQKYPAKSHPQFEQLKPLQRTRATPRPPVKLPDPQEALKKPDAAQDKEGENTSGDKPAWAQS